MAAALPALSSLLAAPALADAGGCTELHANGQRETNAGRLKSAFEMYTRCSSDEACPQAIRNECTDLLVAVEKNLPTIVLSVLDATGKELKDVEVFAGNVLVASSIDGRPIAIDPGQHAFRFVLPSGESLATSTLILEGEKSRLVSARQTPVADGVPAAAPLAPVGPAASQPAFVAKSRPLPVGFWVATAVGGAALASFATFGIVGSQYDAKLEECAPSCPASRRDDYDSARRNYLVADISGGVALVSFGVAAALYFTSTSTSKTSTAAKPTYPALALVPLRGKGAAVVLTERAF